MSELQVLQMFKSNLISFFDDLISQYPMEGDLLYMRIFIKDQIPIQDVMKIFIERLFKDEQKIRKMAVTHNDKFFLEHNIFEELSHGKAQHFKRLWVSETITEEDKDAIWSWVDRFILIADKYIKIRPDLIKV